jgi:hypothetical protein
MRRSIPEDTRSELIMRYKNKNIYVAIKKLDYMRRRRRIINVLVLLTKVAEKVKVDQ